MEMQGSDHAPVWADWSLAAPLPTPEAAPPLSTRYLFTGVHTHTYVCTHGWMYSHTHRYVHSRVWTTYNQTTQVVPGSCELGPEVFMYTLHEW